MRRQIPVLALVLVVPSAVVAVLERLAQRLAQRCQTQKRGRRAATQELRLDPDRANAEEEPPEEETARQAA